MQHSSFPSKSAQWRRANWFTVPACLAVNKGAALVELPVPNPSAVLVIPSDSYWYIGGGVEKKFLMATFWVKDLLFVFKTTRS